MRKILIGLATLWISAALLCPRVGAISFPGTQGLPNGDFEQGDNGAWTVSGDAYIVGSNGTGQAVFADPANIFANNCLGFISQQVIVPVDLPELGFRLNMVSTDVSGTGTDQFSILVNGFWLVETFHLTEANQTLKMVMHVADLGAWAGETIDLYFGIQTDDADPSVVIVDDVFLAPQGYVFSDGFEGAGTYVWSYATP